MLHSNQFGVNEAWLAFRLNEMPIRTERDGAFDCVALMDAASCFILGSELLPIDESEPIQEIRRLLESGQSHKQQFPRTLLLARELQMADLLAQEAERQGIEVVRVCDSELLMFTGEARAGFRQHTGA